MLRLSLIEHKRTKTALFHSSTHFLCMSKEVTIEELSEHNITDDGWIALNGIVYDISDFVQESSLHPGGMDLVKEYLGKDISVYNILS